MPKPLKPILDMIGEELSKRNNITVLPKDFIITAAKQNTDGSTEATITPTTGGVLAGKQPSVIRYFRHSLADMIAARPSNVINVITKGATINDVLDAINQSTGWGLVTGDINSTALAWPANNKPLSVILQAATASLRYTGAAAVILNPVKYLLSDLLPDNVLSGKRLSVEKEAISLEFQVKNNISLINGYFSLSDPVATTDPRGTKTLTLTGAGSASGYLGSVNVFYTEDVLFPDLLRDGVVGDVVVFSNGFAGAGNPSNAINPANTSYWRSNPTPLISASNPKIIGVGYYDSKSCVGYSLTNPNLLGTSTPYPRSWTFEGGNDDGTWEVIHTVADDNNVTNSAVRPFSFPRTKAYRAYRLSITQGTRDRPDIGIHLYNFTVNH